MKLHLYNTLSRKIEAFVPIEPGKVRMYSCGPTVYDFVTIGNLRTYITVDILVRTFKNAGYVVEHIQNITDFGHLSGDNDASEGTGEDRMEKGARREGKSPEEIAQFYLDAYVRDADEVNNLRPERWTRATEHISEQIALLQKLEGNGFTYLIEGDGIYFDTSKVANYNIFFPNDKSSTQDGSRIDPNPRKRQPADFALWKFSSATKAKRFGSWESPWGIGFPGWHIECSAMSMKYLGEQFDLHAGGIDLAPVHHTNEIAQNEAATGKIPTVKYWLHCAHLMVDGKRMGKSEGNAYTLADLHEKGFDPLDLRYLVLGTHYRQTQNFTWESLAGAREARLRLKEQVARLEHADVEADEGTIARFGDALAEDLNTSKALAVIWELLKDKEIGSSAKRASILKMDEVLGLNLFSIQEVNIPETVTKLTSRREEARKEKDWAKADELRQEIEKAGFVVKDTDDGPTLSPVR